MMMIEENEEAENQYDFLMDQPFNSAIDKTIIRDDQLKGNSPLYITDYDLEKYDFIINENEQFINLAYCAFFASHFKFFKQYSYFLASGIGYTQLSHQYNSIPDNCVLYYKKDKCCFNIMNFLNNSHAINDSSQQNSVNFFETIQPISFIKYMTEFLEDFGYCYFYTIIKPNQSIKSIIENDFIETKTPKYYIFEVNTPVSYRTQVILNGTPFYYRITWGISISENKLIFIDLERNIFELENTTKEATKKFTKKGVPDLDQNFLNLNYVCLTLDMS